MTLPTGTVTFLFTDIEGSTKLAQAHPDKWESLQRHHHAMLQSAIEAHNGYVFQVIGDAFCAAFHTAKDGLEAALQAQRALARMNNESGKRKGNSDQENSAFTIPPSSLVIKVRMGLHTGSAEIHGKEYRGYMTLARSQRVMSVAYGGQILLSNASAEMIHSELPEEITLRDMKEHRLKGLLNPEHLWQVVAPDLQHDFPALQSLNEIPNNLPAQLTSFIGRENEIVELKQELETYRLVTLTGSGGTGKTRLSLQVAATVLDAFPKGVWFIELAPLVDPDLIPQTILSTIGISEQPGKPPIEILKEYLHDRKALIVLDNCEHLVTASAQVANALLNAAPNLKVLASSREALGVKGELSYPVPSLSLPDVKHLPSIEQLPQYEAVRLFIDRALMVNPHFVVDKDNAPFIAQVCYRLDGIPLAIELAAARVRMMSVEQISNRLNDRFRLLTGGARTALPRQQTLRALIDWSYDHLPENEQLLLRRLSVFAGGWTLEAAEEVCVGQDAVLSSSKDDILSYDILDLLTQLVNKSLVVVMEHSQSGETRYRMLETIRQYAREKLLEAGGSEVIRQHHLAYFVTLAELAEPELYRSNQVFWFNKLDDEFDNLRMALDWALASDVESGLRIKTASWLFWFEHGYLQEMENWFAQFLPLYKKDDTLRAKALVIQSRAIAVQGDFTRARNIGGMSVQLARALNDKRIEGLGLLNLGQIIGFSGNLDECIPMLENGLALLKETGDKWGQALTIGAFAMSNRDLERSKSYLLEALRLHRELRNLAGIAYCLGQLAQKSLWTGDLSSAAQALEESLEIYRQMGSLSGEAETLGYFGNLAYWLGNYQQACDYYDECIVLGEKINYQMSILWAQANRAYAIFRQGNIQQAIVEFKNSMRRMHLAGVMIGVIYAVEGLASLYLNIGQPARAARLFAWGDAMREKTGDYRPLAEQNSIDKDLAVIHSKVDDTAFAKLYDQGRGLTIEQAIALALEE